MAAQSTRRPYAICLCVDKFMLPPAAYLAERLARLAGSERYDVLLFLPPLHIDNTIRSFAAQHGFFVHESTEYERFAKVPIAKTGLNQATFQRLVLPSYLTGQYEKILYMDVDVEVRHPIASIFNLDLGASPFAAVVDWRAAEARSLSQGNLQRYQRGLGLTDDDDYFNAGIMLIEMANWHAESLTERALAFLAANPALCWNADQSALNAVARKRFLHLTPVWNMFGRHFHQMQLSSVCEAVVVHYIRFQKHWAKAGIYNKTQAYREITDWLAASPWPEWQTAPSQHIAWYRSAQVRRLLRKVTGQLPPAALSPQQVDRRKAEFLAFCRTHQLADIEQGLVDIDGGIVRPAGS